MTIDTSLFTSSVSTKSMFQVWMLKEQTASSKRQSRVTTGRWEAELRLLLLRLEPVDTNGEIPRIASPEKVRGPFYIMKVNTLATQGNILKPLDQLLIALVDGEVKRFGDRTGAFQRAKGLEVDLSFVRFEHISLFTDPQNLPGHRPAFDLSEIEVRKNSDPDDQECKKGDLHDADAGSFYFVPKALLDHRV